MAERLAKSSDIGEYQLYHFNAVTADTHVTGTGTHGDFIGRLVVNQAGSGVTIKLGNGTTNTASNIFAVITPSTSPNFEYEGVCDQGLYIAISGTTIGDYTISAISMAV